MPDVRQKILLTIVVIIGNFICSSLSTCVNVTVTCTAGEYPEEITWDIKKGSNVLCVSNQQ